MRVDAFDFDLPQACIALRPVVPRDAARMLGVCAPENISDHLVGDLADQLHAGDVLVLNDTKVFPAHLVGQRPARAHGGGGPARISVNLHQRVDAQSWQAFARPARRLRIGDHIQFSDAVSARVQDKGAGGEVVLQFTWGQGDLTDAFGRIGQMPLPPYIGSQRSIDAQDARDYQTIFADEAGSVAAPTAGLHFTDQMFEKLAARGIIVCFLTLHVGAGTFLPVKVDETDDHVMHFEWREIPKETADIINLAKAEGRRVIAVGTTSMRSLESAVDQNGLVVSTNGSTDIFITPGYTFQVVDGLLTNFHLPKSTLFMLVSAFCGLSVMQKAYAHAISTGYRFYSYGDACLLWRADACDN